MEDLTWNKKALVFLLDLFEKGLDNKDEGIGYHGTSLEAIEQLLVSGKLIGRTTEDKLLRRYNLGDISFFPVKTKFPEHPLFSTFLDDDKIIGEAAGYAEDNARAHAFLKLVGLNNVPEMYEHGKQVSFCSWRFGREDYFPFMKDEKESVHAFLKRGVSICQIREAFLKTRHRKGVVLGLSEKILEFYEISGGDKGEGDLVIKARGGLDYCFLCGLEPLGEEEWDFFERLQKQQEELNKNP